MFEFVNTFKSERTFFFYFGRVALYAILKALGITKGDEIIIQVFTCFEVPTPIVRLGAIPIYVDINPNNLNLDSEKIEEKITSKTKAVIVQHTFGIPAEIDKISNITNKYNIPIIEDCCHAFGSKYCGQEVGTFGDAAFYSFGWNKPIVLGTGGAAVINNPVLLPKMKKLYEKFSYPSINELLLLSVQRIVYNLLVTPSLFSLMRDIYRNPFLRRLLISINKNKNSSPPKNKEIIGTYTGGKLGDDMDYYYINRIIRLQDKKLVKIIVNFDKLVSHQKWVVSEYKNLINSQNYKHLDLDNRFEPIFYKYPIFSDKKKSIYENARRAKIELSDMFRSPLYSQLHQARWESLGYKEGICPVSEKISDSIIPMSTHQKIKSKDIKRTIEFLSAYDK